jgi:hypothetical protein
VALGAEEQPAAAAASGSTSAAAPGGAVGATLLLAPEECFLHRTAPEPLRRGGPEPPPENINRLHVLTRPGGHSRGCAPRGGWRAAACDQARAANGARTCGSSACELAALALTPSVPQ